MNQLSKIPLKKWNDLSKLDRAFSYYGILRSNISTPEFREIDVALAPQFADYSAKITQNQRLFSRLQTIYQRSQKPFGG